MQWGCIHVFQVEEYQGMLENSGLVGYAQEVLKETDQSCFVQTAKQLHVRYSPVIIYVYQWSWLYHSLPTLKQIA